MDDRDTSATGQPAINAKEERVEAVDQGFEPMSGLTRKNAARR
jgi:hypothetical protein